MSDSITTPLSRVVRPSRNPIIWIGLVILVSLIAEGLLVANYFQLTPTVQQNFAPDSKLLLNVISIGCVSFELRQIQEAKGS